MNAQHNRGVRLLQILTVVGMAAHAAQTALALPLPSDPATQYNISKNTLAISGYDPVAYFPEGGSMPVKGDERITATDHGATYRFASKAHLDLFKANPEKYAPAHGGWCSYAMGKDGSKVEVDPKSFVVANDRLFLFYKDLFTDTRKSFLKEQAVLTKSADENWKKTSGEEPRAGKNAANAAGLQSRLDAARGKMEANAPQQAKDVFNSGIKNTAESGVLDRAMKVGAVAPDFVLPDATGKSVQLSTLLKDGPVVMTWYRGGWCPYCNIQLAAYQEAMPDLKAAGATLVALSPQLPDSSLSTAEKDKLEFPVLSDVGNKVARQYGIVYTMAPEVREALKGRLDLAKYNGDETWELPLAATYVIAKDGKVAYAFVDADYRKRAEPAEIVAALKQLR
jgi:peroxiredoxin/YHS domain-containing protein